MASPIQFIREQIADEAINPAKLDLTGSSGTYNFSSTTINVATKSTGTNDNSAASTAFVQQEISDNQVGAGRGIDLDTGTGNLSVDCIGSTGLTFSSTADDALLKIDLDGSSLVLGIEGLKINASGVGTTELADDAVTQAKISNAAVGTNQIEDNAVNSAKVAFTPYYEEFRADGSSASFTVANSIDSNFGAATVVFKNGQRMSYVTSSPSADEYTASGTSITFGSSPTAGVSIMVNYWSQA